MCQVTGSLQSIEREIKPLLTRHSAQVPPCTAVRVTSNQRSAGYNPQRRPQLLREYLFTWRTVIELSLCQPGRLLLMLEGAMGALMSWYKPVLWVRKAHWKVSTGRAQLSRRRGKRRRARVVTGKKHASVSSPGEQRPTDCWSSFSRPSALIHKIGWTGRCIPSLWADLKWS